MPGSFVEKGNIHGYDRETAYFREQNLLSLGTDVPDFTPNKPAESAASQNKIILGDKVFLVDKDLSIDYKNVTAAQVWAMALKSCYVDMVAGVTGGGVIRQSAYLEMQGIKRFNSSSETSGVGEAIGYIKSSKEIGISGFVSTHMAGFVTASDYMRYIAKNARIPLLAIIGSNLDGRSDDTHFQPGDLQEYSQLFKGNIYETKVEHGQTFDPQAEVERIINVLKPMMAKMLLEGTAGVVAYPYNLTGIKVELSPEQIEKLTAKPDVSEKPLSDDAIAKLDMLYEMYQQEGSSVLYTLGAGMSHANRLGGYKLIPEFQKFSKNKMVGGVLTDPEGTHMLSGASNELVSSSHVMDLNVAAAIKKFNIEVCIGGAPNASITMNRADLATHQSLSRKGRLFMIDTAEKLESLKNEFPDMIGIDADPRAAIEYLNRKKYGSPTVKLNVIEAITAKLQNDTRTSHIMMKKSKDSPEEINTEAEGLRDIHLGLADLMKNESGRRLVVACSGNSGGKLLKYLDFTGQNTSAEDNMKVIYPEQGILGYVAGATLGAINSGKYDKILLVAGDGGSGYMSDLELKKVHAAAKKKGVSVNFVALDNGGHKSVEAAIPLITDGAEVQEAGYDQTPTEFVGYKNKSYTVEGCRSSEAEPDANSIAKAAKEGFQETGLNVIYSNIASIQSVKKPMERTA